MYLTTTLGILWKMMVAVRAVFFSKNSFMLFLLLRIRYYAAPGWVMYECTKNSDWLIVAAECGFLPLGTVLVRIKNAKLIAFPHLWRLCRVLFGVVSF